MAIPDGAGPRAAAPRRLPQPPGSRSDDSGLVTLEWLLIVSAIAGLAAVSALAVQQVLQGTSEIPADPAVRVIDADIAAAFIAQEANTAALAGVLDFSGFEQRCDDLEAAFQDIVQQAVWAPPTVDATDPLALILDSPARCTVTLRSDLGG